MGSSFCSKKNNSQNKAESTRSETEQPVLNREDSFDIDPDIEFHQNNHQNNMSSTASKKRKLEDESSDSEPPKKKQKNEKKDKKEKNHKKDDKKDEVMTRNEFLKYAKSQIAVCGDIKFAVKKKRNKTGSVGFNTSHHDVISLNKDKKVDVMVGLNATVIGSKSWEDGDKLSDDEDEDEDDDLKVDNKKKDKKKDKKGDKMTKSEFLSLAKDLKLEMFDQEFILKPKKAKSGSVGWGVAGLKIKTTINDIPLRLQTSVNITVKKSKDWDES